MAPPYSTGIFLGSYDIYATGVASSKRTKPPDGTKGIPEGQVVNHRPQSEYGPQYVSILWLIEVYLIKYHILLKNKYNG